MFPQTLLLRHIPFPFSHHCISPTKTTITPIQSHSQRALETTCRKRSTAVSASVFENPQPLDLTEGNVRRALAEARLELSQLFDDSVGITGQAELAELDGPFVKISLKGRFWHKRSTVVARLGNYLKQRIPEILEVDIEDDQQLDDSPASF